MKNARLLAAISFSLIASALQQTAHAEPSKQAQDSGVWMIVTYNVVDYAHWKPVHDRSAAVKRDYGWSECSVFALDGDRNHIMLMEHFSSLERARAFAESTAMRDEMAASGVATNPEIKFVQAMPALAAK